MQVTGIGQCSFDYLAMVDQYPSVDTKKEVLSWHEQGGGPVATALITLCRLGISTRFYGVIGDDATGDKIRDSLVNEGVDVSGLVTRKDSLSQVAFIAIERDGGSRTIFWKRPSGNPLLPDEVGPSCLSECSFLLLDGLMEEVSLFAAARAKAAHVPVMVDAGRLRPGMMELIRSCDYVVGSEEFARDLGWELTPEMLSLERRKLGIPILTITLGPKGSITASENELFHVPAFGVKAVDSTGAGDVFHGAYIYGAIKGWPLRDTVIFASAVAALQCTQIGGRSGIPSLNETLDFLGAKGIMLGRKQQ